MQAEIYLQQKKIMESPNPQTTELIDYDKANAAAAKSFAGSADSINRGIADAVNKLNLQAESTHDLAVQAKVQSEATQSLSIHTESLARTAVQQLDSSERPWMMVALQFAVLPNEPAPIYFDPDGNLHIGIVINSQNVGKSPAVKVRAVSKLVPSTSQVDGETEEREMCDSAHLSDRINGEGDTVFVGVPYQTPQYLTIDAKTIRAELANPSDNSFTTATGGQVLMLGDRDMFGSMPAMTAKILGGDTAPSLSIMGCLDYSIDYSERRLQTMFMYRLDGIDFRTHDTRKATISINGGWGNKAK